MSHHRYAKRKGTQAERDLLDQFWEAGWSAHRIAGSGSSKYPSPDLIVGTPLRKLAIEVKKTKDHAKYFSQEEIAGLQSFCSIFGAEGWVAVQFGKEDWYFLSLEDIEKTEKGYKVNLSLMQRKGLLFEEVIQ